MTRGRRGFTLIELLVVMLLLNIAMAGVVGVLRTYTHVEMRGDADAARQQDLRFAMDLVTDAVRYAGYGVPAANLPLWFPWINGFGTNPKIETDASGSSVLSVASVTSAAVTTLAARVNVGATEVPVASVTGFNNTAKALLLIGDSENALVTRVSGGNLVIDTNPQLAGNQGLTRWYPQGTPVFRVDVLTYSITTDASGRSQLVRDDNQGAGARPIADQIATFQVTTLVAKRYRATMTAVTTSPDPLNGGRRQSTLQSTVALAN